MKTQPSGSTVRKLEARVRAMRKALDGSRRADRSLCDAHRAVLRSYEDAVRSEHPGTRSTPEWKRLRALAKRAMLYLGGEADVWSRSLKDYDHRLYGPYLGVSDEGSAATVIRRAALDSPKVKATRVGSPMIAGVAHDAERLASIGEVPVGPSEYADIRLECTGRILTSTNVGTRLNLRFYKRYPVAVVPPGPVAAVLGPVKEELQKIFAPFLKTPDGEPRPLMVFVEFDRESRRTFGNRVAILRKLVRYVSGGTIADRRKHQLGFQMRIGFGAKGGRAALLAINLARAAGIKDVAIDGVVRKEAEEFGSFPGLLNYLPPEHLQPVLDRARAKGVRIRPKNTVDPDTVARHVWTSLLAAREMGLALGKYGTFPLTLEETDDVVRKVQGWFSDWSAAPVFFVDQGILSAEKVFVGDSLMQGLRKWLMVVGEHGVRVVLIDTVDKSKGFRILRDESRPESGFLSAREIASIDRFAASLNVKVLWAGGITLPQAYEFGNLGVFGIYVTSAAASSAPVPPEYSNDPLLASLKEPTYEGVYRTKLLLEAGFLSARWKRSEVSRTLEKLSREMIAALNPPIDKKVLSAIEGKLAALALGAWRKHLRKRRPGTVPGLKFTRPS